MRDLLVIVPSRGRPGNVGRLIESFLATVRGESELLFCFDQDDPTLKESLSHFSVGIPGIGYCRAPAQHLVPWLNEVALWHTESHSFLGHFGDDNVPRTEGWDVNVAESLRRQGTGFCFCNDLDPVREAGALACHIFMTSNIVRELGYFGPKGFEHMYVDYAWNAWGKATSMEYLSEVVIEHLHFLPGKVEMDETYRASRALVSADASRWHRYEAHELDSDINKIGWLRA